MTDARRDPGAHGRPAQRSWAVRFCAALLSPVDAAWLAAFRILFGLTMCVSMLRFIAFGWVDEFFVQPAFQFKYWGFGWVQPLSGPAMHALFWTLAVLAVCVASGVFFRLAAFGLALGFAYLQLVDVATYLNHYYLAGLLSVLLALSPAQRAFSLGTQLRPRCGRDSIAAGWLYLFRFQIGVVYAFAGLAKAQSDWLLHAQPLRIWLGSKTGMPVLGAFLAQEWAAPLMSWGGFLFDATIVCWLLWPKTRPFAYAIVIAFHAMVGALFDIGMFPVIMVVAALVFFSPSWPRDLLRAARGLFVAPSSELACATRARSSTPPAPAAPAPRPVHLLVAAALVLYCALSVAMPLRHLAYGGNVLWHEQGMRWSWRVMLREKNGSITYRVRDKRTGKQWHVPPSRYLTRLQEREMAGQPDLILQLAHHIHDEFERRAGGPVEVRVDALVSLNGRRMRRLIDSNVDLSTIRDGITKAHWILASPSEPPPYIQPVRHAEAMARSPSRRYLPSPQPALEAPQLQSRQP